MNENFFGARVAGPNATFFRMWAPNAKRVDVVGDFNHWQPQSAPLQSQPGGFWQGTIQGIATQDRYKYVITRQDDGQTFRIDPAARDTQDSSVDNLNNHGLVVDTSHPWPDFHTPAFDDLIIYQCHVGSFCGRGDQLHRSNGVATFGDLATKLDYIRDLGFNALALLPVQEFRYDRSWGYNPSFYYALESAYGRPSELRQLISACHHRGLAVIFDAVYNHISNIDNSFYHFDENVQTGRGSYLSDHQTSWGPAPAFYQQGIKDFFLGNIRMYFEDYRADGLRFDATRHIELNHGWGDDGWRFMQDLTYRSKQLFPDKYLIAEHVPDHDTIVRSAGFHATWYKDACERFRRAMDGSDPVANIAAILGTNLGPGHQYPFNWSVVKYLLGSHDECGDNHNGQKYHRYFVEHYGGRDNWYARAKAKMGWALNVAMQNTPMLFMGNECHLDGYWHDGPDQHGDHRFDWPLAGDHHGIPMRKLVSAANAMRWQHRCLRSGSLEITHQDHQNHILAFKRWTGGGDVVLVVVNAGDGNYSHHDYGLRTGQPGQWEQILCSQDRDYGGWDGAGNAYHQPWTQSDGKIHINVPQWSVTMLKLL